MKIKEIKRAQNHEADFEFSENLYIVLLSSENGMLLKCVIILRW